MASHPRCSPFFLLAAVLTVPPAASAATVAFTPGTLLFGNVALTETRIMTATLKNGTALDVGLTGFTLGGVNPGAYSQTNTCPTVLPAGQSCTVSVTFKPWTLKPLYARMIAGTNDPLTPSVTLSLGGNLYPALNDTGIIGCGDASANNLPCPAAGFPEQDAEKGRDKTRSWDGNGHAGFNFTKLDANGNSLPASATSWNCVRDNVTGLVWEVRPAGDGKIGNQGLHDADDVYTWYSTDTANNGGSVGYADYGGGHCHGYDSTNATTYCNTEDYAKRVNAAGWCGKKDWRLPDIFELESLVDMSLLYPSPIIDTAYFPDAVNVPASWYWSSSPTASGGQYAWGIYLDYGNSYQGSTSGYGYIRLVRGGR